MPIQHYTQTRWFTSICYTIYTIMREESMLVTCYLMMLVLYCLRWYAAHESRLYAAAAYSQMIRDVTQKSGSVSRADVVPGVTGVQAAVDGMMARHTHAAVPMTTASRYGGKMRMLRHTGALARQGMPASWHIAQPSASWYVTRTAWWCATRMVGQNTVSRYVTWLRIRYQWRCSEMHSSDISLRGDNIARRRTGVWSPIES